MFPQKYGSKLYGNRFPTEKEQTFSAYAKGKAAISSMLYIVLLYFAAFARGKTSVIQRNVFFSIAAKTIAQVKVKKNITAIIIAKVIGRAKLHKKTELLPFIASASGKATMAKAVIKEPLKVAARGIAWITRHFWRIGELGFVGDFAPGDVIEIDTDKMTIKKNGTNVLHLTEEHFFMLGIGEQEIIYRDAESERNIKINVQRRDRWL